MKRVGRNDPCPCGSGKKFKKCCESKMVGGRFQATHIPSQAKVGGLTSLFQKQTSAIPKKTDEKDPIPPMKKKEE